MSESLPPVILQGPEPLTTNAHTQLQAVYHLLPEACVGGSVGRQIMYASYDPQVEPLPVLRRNRTPRDIDVISPAGIDDRAALPATKKPLYLDTGCCSWFRQEANGLWFVFPEDLSIAEEVQPELFDPVTRQVGDLHARTFSVPTHAALNRCLYGGLTRLKDRKSFARFQAFADDLEYYRRAIPADRAPYDTMYLGLETVAAAIRQKHPTFMWRRRIQGVHDVLPITIQNLARPAAHFVIRLLRKYDQH